MLDLNNAATIYVCAKYGNDYASGLRKTETGDLQGPLKTLDAALELVRQLRMTGSQQPITIELLGDYFVEKTICIDNGINNVTITGNGKIHSGLMIDGFREDEFNGKRCFSAPVPKIEDGFWFADFFVDGVRADATTVPKQGCFYADTVENTEKVYDASSRWFTARAEDLEYFKKLRGFNDCRIKYYHYWVDEQSPIEQCDFETGKITMKYQSRFSISGFETGAVMRYCLENVAEAFENENEWYLDRLSGRVYYIPRSPEQTPENIRAYAPVCAKLFEICGEPNKRVSGIGFSDLEFCYTSGDYCSRASGVGNEPLAPEHPGYAADEQSLCSAGGAIEFYYAENCEIRNCRMKNVGIHAVCIGEGCHRLNIYANNIEHTGAGAIKVSGAGYGCEREEMTYGNSICQNRISNYGRRYAAACGVLLMHSFENTIAHNDIAYGYYSGISVGWVWGYDDSISRDNIIEYNRVHHIGQGKLSDMGGIYLLGKQQGTIVRNNIVHDVTSWSYGAYGIYTDEGSSYILIESNIVYNVASYAFHQHFGCGNVVRNNIAANCGQIIMCARSQAHTGMIVEKNIFVANEKAAYHYGYIDTPASGYVHMLRTSNNLHYSQGKHTLFEIGERKYDLKRAVEEFSAEVDSVFADPMFRDLENNDFSLDDASPAYALGFKSIDTSNIGVTIKNTYEVKEK